MKIIILFIFLFTIPLIGISQNRKEQIATLNYRVDSCKTIINKNFQNINSTQKTIDSCNVILVKEKQELDEKKNKVSELNLHLVNKKQLFQAVNNESISVQNEIELIKEKIPLNVFFKYKTTSLTKADYDGNLFTTDIYLMINNQEVDKYTQSGEPTYDLELEKDWLYINQENFMINYGIIVESSTITVVIEYRKESGGLIRQDEMNYLKNSAGQWKFSHCTGDCDE